MRGQKGTSSCQPQRAQPRPLISTLGGQQDICATAEDMPRVKQVQGQQCSLNLYVVGLHNPYLQASTVKLLCFVTTSE